MFIWNSGFVFIVIVDFISFDRKVCVFWLGSCWIGLGRVWEVDLRFLSIIIIISRWE